MKHQAGICSEIENALPLFVGGDLEGDASRAIEAHLMHCAACSLRMHAAREAHGVLVRALRSHSAPGPDLWSGVRAVLWEEGLLARGLSSAGSTPTPRSVASFEAAEFTSRSARSGAGEKPLAWQAESQRDDSQHGSHAARSAGPLDSATAAVRSSARSEQHKLTSLSRWMPYSIAAAAALAGFLVGRVWLTTPEATPSNAAPIAAQETNTRSPLNLKFATDSSLKDTLPSSPTLEDGANSVRLVGAGSPAAAPDRLRRLERGEQPMGRDAEWVHIEDTSFRIPAGRSLHGTGSGNAGIPVGLQRVVRKP